MKFILKFLSSMVILYGIVSPGSVVGQETSSDEPQAPTGLMWRYIQAVDSVSARLSTVDGRLANACAALSETGLQGPKASEILHNLSDMGPWMVDAITIDPDGTILEVEPQEYQYIKGTNIGDEEHVKDFMATKRPTGMDYISAVEGFDGIVFTAPVFDDQSEFLGAASILVNSTELFGSALEAFQPASGAKIGVMAPNGLIIYDADSLQIGKNTFSDPLFLQYADIQSLGRRMEVERNGFGTYEFSNTTREALWTTVDFQGREIRVVLNVDMIQQQLR